MAIYRLYQDTDNCIGCQSCTFACKSRRGLPVGPLPNQVISVGPQMVDGQPRAAFVFMSCLQCDDPVCVAVCPNGAMQQRESDGIVWVDHNLCVGCKASILACPWGAPQWDPVAGRVVKCDYCLDRLEAGLQPLCVTVCATHCLSFGLAAEMPAPEDGLSAQEA